jgi:hypothetical protein
MQVVINQKQSEELIYHLKYRADELNITS